MVKEITNGAFLGHFVKHMKKQFQKNIGGRDGTYPNPPPRSSCTNANGFPAYTGLYMF